MAQKFVNNLVVTLTANINANQTSISVNSTAKFPVLELGDWFYLTISDKREGGELRWEVIKVNSWSGNTLTCIRGQDSTVGQLWSTGAELSLRITAADMFDYEQLKDSKGQLNGIAPLVAGTVPTSFLPDYINPSTAASIGTRVKTTVESPNATHTLRKDSWLWNFDGAVTGAIAIELVGMWGHTISGAMELVVTQNHTVDGVYPDYSFYLGGNWRAGDHAWHNTEARVVSNSNDTVSVRFASNGVDKVYMVLGDVSTQWKYPRIIVKDAVTNDLVAYSPEFVITLETALPSQVNSTINLQSVGTPADFNTALTAALV